MRKHIFFLKGTISVYEFILSFNLIGVSHNRPDPSKKIDYFFDMYDNNNNGQLDIYEIYNALYGILSLTGLIYESFLE